MGTTFVNDCWTWSYGGGTWWSWRSLRPAVTPSSTYFEIEFEVELELTTPLAGDRGNEGELGARQPRTIPIGLRWTL